MAVRDPDGFVREVTRRIAAARQAAGLTQEAAAQRYGTALKNWQRFEAGQNITLHTLARIAGTIGTTPEALAGGSGKATLTATVARKLREGVTPARAAAKSGAKDAPAPQVAPSAPKRRKADAKKAPKKRLGLAAN